MDITYFISSETAHHLTMYAFNLIYLIPFVLLKDMVINNKETKIIRSFNKICACLLLVICLFIGYHNTVYSNGAYTYKKLVYDNTLLHAQTIWKDINSIENYVEGETEVLFVGSFWNSSINYNSSIQNRYLNVLTGAFGSSITYEDTAEAYYYAILGRNIKITYDESKVDIKEYENMPAYPKNGYCKMINDVVVVKVSY